MIDGILIVRQRDKRISTPEIKNFMEQKAI
jgi:hypothetical protein